MFGQEAKLERYTVKSGDLLYLCYTETMNQRPAELKTSKRRKMHLHDNANPS